LTARKNGAKYIFMRIKIPGLRRKNTALIVVDIQERLLPQIFEKERLVENTVRLIRGLNILHIPILVTEQYRKGLGATAPQVAVAIPGFSPIEKMAFSACGAKGFNSALRAKKIKDVLLCGMEAHVCITLTCLDLLQDGFQVFVVADAVSSRTPDNRSVGLERMRDAGASIVSVEMVLFELLERCGTDEFKQILKLVR
jgi:nicotinamidase-related amidase